MTGCLVVYAALTGVIVGVALATSHLPDPRRWATRWRTQCKCGAVRRAPYRWVNDLRRHVHVRTTRHRVWRADYQAKTRGEPK